MAAQAIGQDSTNPVLYCNRSAAAYQLGQYLEALEDASRALRMAPGRPKSLYRRGAAFAALGRCVPQPALTAASSSFGVDTEMHTAPSLSLLTVTQFQSQIRRSEGGVRGGSAPLPGQRGARDQLAGRLLRSRAAR